MNRFFFPVVVPLTAGATVSRTYASVTGSILRRIAELGAELRGIAVCPREGYFEVILYPYAEGIHGGRVRLRFNFPNLYLEAFKTHGTWYRLRDMHPMIVPAGAPGHRYVVEPLPFESSYQRRGLWVDFSTLSFGRSVIFEIYTTPRDFPNNAGGTVTLKENLARICVLFPEAMRFPVVRRFLVLNLKLMRRVTVNEHRWMFNVWGRVCRAIRLGPDVFEPIEGTNLDSYEKVVEFVSVILYTVAA